MLQGERLGVPMLLNTGLLGVVFGVPTTHEEREIGRVAKQGAGVVDQRLGELQVVPRVFDDIGKALAVLPRFAHQFKKQEIKTTQGAQAPKVRREWARLSRLKNRRA